MKSSTFDDRIADWQLLPCDNFVKKYVQMLEESLNRLPNTYQLEYFMMWTLLLMTHRWLILGCLKTKLNTEVDESFLLSC